MINPDEYMYDILWGDGSRVERDVDEIDEKEHIKIVNGEKILCRIEKLNQEFSKIDIMIKTIVLGEEVKTLKLENLND